MMVLSGSLLRKGMQIRSHLHGIKGIERNVRNVNQIIVTVLVHGIDSIKHLAEYGHIFHVDLLSFEFVTRYEF